MNLSEKTTSPSDDLTESAGIELLEADLSGIAGGFEFIPGESMDAKHKD